MASWHRTGVDYRLGRDHRDVLLAETWSGSREAVEVVALSCKCDTDEAQLLVVDCFTVRGELVSG